MLKQGAYVSSTDPVNEKDYNAVRIDLATICKSSVKCIALYAIKSSHC